MSKSKIFLDELTKGSDHLSKNDAVLSDIIKKIGRCNLRPRKIYFEMLINSIVSQQLSLQAAESIFNKFRLLYGSNEFPDAKKIIDTPDKDLRSCGLSNSKINYIKDLSNKIIQGIIDINILYKTSDNEIIEKLMQVKGIGLWTAHMFLIFSLGRLDVLPHGDLGFRKAVYKNYKLRKLPGEEKILLISKKHNWKPYCTIATWYHWQSLKLT